MCEKAGTFSFKFFDCGIVQYDLSQTGKVFCLKKRGDMLYFIVLLLL